MRTLSTRFRRRRGVSNVFGTIFFIGIMFTAVIPMFLVMKQADTVYEKKTLELRKLDDERGREDIELYAFPNDLSEPGWINVTATSRCEVDARLLRIWINNETFPLDLTVTSMGTVDVGMFNVGAKNGSTYYLRTATDRGNVFESETGALHFNNGEWESETLGFNLIFPSRPGRGKRQNSWLNEMMITIEQDGDLLYNNVTMHWAVSASEMFFEVGTPGTYRVVVYIWCKPPPYQRWEKIFDDSSMVIDWPLGPAVVDLSFVIDGDQLMLP